MNSVRLYYIKYQGENDLAQINELQLKQWLTELPLVKQQAVQRFVHNRDRMASLLATRLLKICVDMEGIEGFRLSDIRYPDNGKPSWINDKNIFLDFNISHSDEMILVAVSKFMNVGIDVEKVRELKRLNFKMVLSDVELDQIQQTPDLFFNLWSKKEAVVKAADTSGIGRMHEVILEEDQALLDEKKWFLKKVEVDEQYVTYLATSLPVDEIVTTQITISELVV